MLPVTCTVAGVVHDGAYEVFQTPGRSTRSIAVSYGGHVRDVLFIEDRPAEEQAKAILTSIVEDASSFKSIGGPE